MKPDLRTLKTKKDKSFWIENDLLNDGEYNAFIRGYNKGVKEMTEQTLKCDVCGKEHQRKYMSVECAKCYLDGWKKEWEKRRNKK